MSYLVRVLADGPKPFTAGLVLDDQGMCTSAAPILKWCVGKHYSELREAFQRKGWKAERVKASDTPKRGDL